MRPILYLLAILACYAVVAIASGCNDAGTITSPDGSAEIEVISSETRPFNFTSNLNSWEDEPYEEWDGLSVVDDPYLQPRPWRYNNRGECIAYWREPGTRWDGQRVMQGGECCCRADNPRWQSTTERKSCKMCDIHNPKKDDCNCVECRCVQCGYEPEAVMYSVPPEDAKSLKAAAKANNAALARLPAEKVAAEAEARANRRDIGLAAEGPYVVFAPPGDHFADELAAECAATWTAPKDVIVSARYGETECQLYVDLTPGAHRIWVSGKDADEVRQWVRTAVLELRERCEPKPTIPGEPRD